MKRQPHVQPHRRPSRALRAVAACILAGLHVPTVASAQNAPRDEWRVIPVQRSARPPEPVRMNVEGRPSRPPHALGEALPPLPIPPSRPRPPCDPRPPCRPRPVCPPTWTDGTWMNTGMAGRTTPMVADNSVSVRLGSDDGLSIRVRTGDVLFGLGEGKSCRPSHRRRFWCGGRQYVFFPDARWWYVWDSYPRYPVYGQYPAMVDPWVATGGATQPVAAGAEPEPEPRELTVLEMGEVALSAGATRESIELLTRHLAETPGDAVAMRTLALALLADRRIDEGVAMMALAYESDPSLAITALRPDSLPDGTDGLRALVRAVSSFANRADTASSWLTLSILMQAEGRRDQAARMLDRARREGLPERVAAPLARMLGA